MIIADTGLWLALALPRDRHHAMAKQRIADIATQQERLITTCAVMTETCHRCLLEAAFHRNSVSSSNSEPARPMFSKSPPLTHRELRN